MNQVKKPIQYSNRLLNMQKLTLGHYRLEHVWRLKFQVLNIVEVSSWLFRKYNPNHPNMESLMVHKLPRSLRSWTSDFQNFNFRSEYDNFKLYFYWILVIDIQGWKSLPIADRNFDILESRILSNRLTDRADMNLNSVLLNSPWPE